MEDWYNAKILHKCRVCLTSQSLYHDIIHLKDNIDIALDQRQHRLTRTLSPIVACIIRIFHLFALSEAVITADHIICVLIMQGWTMRHHIEAPVLEAGKCFFSVELMEFVAGIGFEGKRADL